MATKTLQFDWLKNQKFWKLKLYASFSSITKLSGKTYSL